MNINDLQIILKDMGYDIKKVVGKNVNVLVDGDRVSALVMFADKLGGIYNPKGGSSSIGRTELPGGFFINAKPKGGGSGAGSEMTTLAESAQCVYSAALWYGDDFSHATFKKVGQRFAIDGSVEKIVTKLPEQWVDSCILTAKELHKEFSRINYTFHRGSRWVDTLENHWKSINRVEKNFANLNKWSPADIYMVSDKGSRIDFTKAKSLVQLNSMMLDAINERDVIGVSLKQVKGIAHLAYKNVGKGGYDYTFDGVTAGKRGFMLSGDGYLRFSGGEIQFRTFGSTWQGEIKGKNANMGKISGGPIMNIMQRNGLHLKTQSQITNRTPALMKDFYKWYKYFEKNGMSEGEFTLEVSKKDHNWWISKFLSAQLLYAIDHARDKDKIVSSMIGYAASESDLSGPYVKVS